MNTKSHEFPVFFFIPLLNNLLAERRGLMTQWQMEGRQLTSILAGRGGILMDSFESSGLCLHSFLWFTYDPRPGHVWVP